MAGGTYAQTLVGFINQLASSPRVRLAMIMGAGLESSWSPATGDSGSSFGPFQIHLPAHPGVSASQANDPLFAVRYMLPAYMAGVRRVPEAMWESDPKHAAALAAFYAERPKNMYADSRIESVWSRMQSNNYGSADLPPGTPSDTGSPSTPGAGTGSGAPVDGFLGLPSAGDIAEKSGQIVLVAVFTMAGLGLVVLGVYRTVKR